MRIALTGATGFVGGELLGQLLEAGHRVSALTRRPQPPRDGVDWIPGALDDDRALLHLMLGADAVVHVAGVVSAPDRDGFAAGNITGTRSVLAAAAVSGVDRFVHVSSLAAREPELSSYGWSKREAELLVEASDRDWTIVRPTGVYGPGDTEFLDVFRMASRGLALLPPPGRMSVVAVDDLARLLLLLAEQREPREVLEVDDGGDYSHAEFAQLVGMAVGKRVRPWALPKGVLSLGARLDRRFRGTGAKLTPDRVGYLCHPDWTADPDRRPPQSLWTATTPTREGLAATAAWYREQGLL